MRSETFNSKLLELLLFVCSGRITSVDEFERLSEKAIAAIEDEADKRYMAYRDELRSQLNLADFLARCLLDKDVPSTASFIRNVIESMGKERDC